MTDEQLLAYAVNHIRRAQNAKLRGSITINFNDGKIVGTSTASHDKPTP